MSRYVTWYVGEMPRNANSFQWEFPPCWNRMSWKQSAGRISERLVGKQIESCTLASKKWGALEAILQMTPIGAAFVCCKASDIIAEEALTVADIKWGTFMRPRSRYEQICHLICRRNATKCQLVPVRIPTLLEQNVLKAVCRTHFGKTSWKTNWKLYPRKQEVSTWGTLTDDP